MCEHKEPEEKRNEERRETAAAAEGKTETKQKRFASLKLPRLRFTPAKIYLYILIILVTVKIIFDIQGFEDFLSKAGAFITSTLSYLIVGLIIAYILNAYMMIWENRILKKMKKKNLRRGLSIVIAYFTLILILALFLFALIPTLIDTAKSFADNLPRAFSKITEFYDDIIEKGRFNLSEEVKNTIESNIQRVQERVMSWFNAENITNFATRFFSTTISGVFNAIMGLMVSVYMLIEKDKAIRMLKRVNYALLPKKHADTIQWGATQCNRIFRKYFAGKLLQACITLILSYVLFLIAGLRYAILLAVIMAFLNMIPYIGPWLGGALVVFITLPQGLFSIVAALICILAVQAADNWFVTPKIVGGRMGVSPLLVLVGLCIFGGLFGLPGMIIGDVMAAIFKTLFYDRYVENRLNNKIKNGFLPKEFDDRNEN